MSTEIKFGLGLFVVGAAELIFGKVATDFGIDSVVSNIVEVGIPALPIIWFLAKSGRISSRS